MSAIAAPASVVVANAARGPAVPLWQRLSAWLATARAYFEAAALYEELNRLSDAELARRGLARENLARDACSACER